MNERIRELTRQATTIEYGVDNGFDRVTFDKEKFAQLIVRECIGIVDDAERGGSNEIWDNAVKFIRRDLKQYFEVERQ